MVRIPGTGQIVVAGQVAASSGVAGESDFGFSRQFTDVVFADGFESDGWWGADWGWNQ